MTIEKVKRLTSRSFLAFVHKQPGPCCICGRQQWEEAHHHGDKGMGQRCNDYEVARVCLECHKKVQGKRKAYFARTGDYDLLARMQADTIELLMAWAAHLEGKSK